MAKAWEKSLACESMHRLKKHFDDVINGKTQELPNEVSEIVYLWSVREAIGPVNLQDGLRMVEKGRGALIRHAAKSKGI